MVMIMQLISVLRLACAFVMLFAVADAAAQERQFSLEANPVHGTAGYGWYRSDTRIYGVEIAFGFPQLDRKLSPDDDESFVDFVHIGAFLRGQPARAFTLDAKVKVGLAELRGCSGCFPGLFTAVSGGAFVGGRRFKVGSRLTAGYINELDIPAEFVLNLTPFAVMFTHDW